MKIGICGLAGSGKDEAAKIIQQILKENGKYFEIDRYAGLLKEATRQVFGENFDDREVKEEMQFVTPELLDRMIDATDYVYLKLGLQGKVARDYLHKCQEHIDPRTWISPRLFQQLLGTEVGRTVDPDIWVNYLKRQERDLIIPDVRFHNELVDFNILITRHPVPKGELHASEVFAAELQLNAYIAYEVIGTSIVHNNSTLQDLKVKLEKTLRFNRLI